jgi:hypothetical protein
VDFDLDPPVHIEQKSVHERLSELLEIRSDAEDRVPSSICGREDVRGAD